MNTINLRQEILKQINHLSDEQLNQVLQFINQFNQGENTTQARYPNPGFDEKGTYGKFVQSGLIGCVEIEENLSTTYKVEK